MPILHYSRSACVPGRLPRLQAFVAPDVPQLRHLACQIGNPNGEQENRGHDSEPEQKTISAGWIGPKLLTLPRTKLTPTVGWHQIRIGPHRLVHGDFPNWPLTWAGSHKKSRERDKPRYRFLIIKKASGGTDKSAR